MNMLQQAIKCPDGKILLPRYEWHFLKHEQEDGRGYFIDWWIMCRIWYSDGKYENLFIDVTDDILQVVDNLVLVTRYWTERFKELSDEELKQRHASKVFPEWIENAFKWRMWLAYRSDKKYGVFAYHPITWECREISTLSKIEKWQFLTKIKCPATAQKWEKKESIENIEEIIECNRYSEKIKKVLTLYRQLDTVSTALDWFVDAVADDWYAIWINVSLSPVVDELIGKEAREDVEYYLYEDIEDKYIELWCGKVYKLNTDEEFVEYMYDTYSKNNELTK